jgi:2-phosphoglycerate kinase
MYGIKVIPGVISEKKVSNGVEIYFQIRDENLKEKFERK